MFEGKLIQHFYWALADGSLCEDGSKLLGRRT
jgi:hypothetical protein